MTAAHRNAFSEHRLEAMLRDGWTPQDVRELIASYRELAAELGFAGDGFVRPKQADKHFRRKLLDAAEQELRSPDVDVYELHLHQSSVEVSAHCGRQFEAPTLAKTIEQVRKHRRPKPHAKNALPEVPQHPHADSPSDRRV